MVSLSGHDIDWKKDKGITNKPCLYIPFNEFDTRTGTASNSVPIRVGNSRLYTSVAERVVDPNGHVHFVGTGSTDRFLFQNPAPPLRYSNHDLILSPLPNIGKTIVFAMKVKFGEFSATRNIYDFNMYAYQGAGGYGLDFTGAGGFRFQVRTRGLTDTNFTNSAVGRIVNPNEWFTVFTTIDVTSDTSQTYRIYVAKNNQLINSGDPVLTYPHNNLAANLIAADSNVKFGTGGGVSYDIKDFLGVVTDLGQGKDIVDEYVKWYSDSENEFRFPNFLRLPKKDLAEFSKTTHYISEHALNGTGTSQISNMYEFWQRWGVQNSAYDGIHLGLGISAFQSSSTPGVYFTQQISDFADWCEDKGITFKLLVNDQTYMTEIELPNHFPHWKKRGKGSVVERAATYWDKIEDFDVETEILNNPNFATYDADRQTEGTYRWFHHVWTLVNAVKDKPAFRGITLGETSGFPIGESDRTATAINVAGQYNRSGIYGITNASGEYLLDKCYSAERQTLYYSKMVSLLNTMLSHRDDLLNSLQINYIRSAVYGNNNPTYSKATKTFTMTSNMFRDGDAVFLLGSGSSYAGGPLQAGMQAHTLYYCVGRTANTFQLAATPNGDPIEFLADITNSAWMGTIESYIENTLNGFSTVSTINGLPMCGELRELWKIVKILKDNNFVISGPDIFTSGIENGYYYLGPRQSSTPPMPESVSVVETLLMAKQGRDWFSDIGPFETCEIQAQDSTYQNLKNATLTSILPNYGEWFYDSTVGAEDPNRISLTQAVRYAKERLGASSVVWFVTHSYPEKTLPDLNNAISKF